MTKSHYSATSQISFRNIQYLFPFIIQTWEAAHVPRIFPLPERVLSPLALGSTSLWPHNHPKCPDSVNLISQSQCPGDPPSFCMLSIENNSPLGKQTFPLRRKSFIFNIMSSPQMVSSSPKSECLNLKLESRINLQSKKKTYSRWGKNWK